MTSNKTIHRIDELAEVGDFTTTRFLSIEPLWEEISIKDRMLLGRWWVITGGESRQRVRAPKPFDLAWARRLRDECRELGFPFFLKQLGGAPVEDGRPWELRLDRGHGGNWEEWPEDLRIREFPCPTRPSEGCLAGFPLRRFIEAAEIPTERRLLGNGD